VNTTDTSSALDAPDAEAADAVDARLMDLEVKLGELEERIVIVADHAQRGIDAAVKEGMEQLASCQQKEPADSSD